MACVSNDTQVEIDVHDHVEAPIRYASIERVYSVSSSPLCCISAVGSHSLMSKKIKAQKLPLIEQFEVEGSGVNDIADCCRPDDYKSRNQLPEIVRVYCRRRKRPRRESVVNTESVKLDDANGWFEEEKQKKRRIGNCEFVKLSVDSSSLRSCTGPRLRNCKNNGEKQNELSRRKGSSVKNQDKVSLASASTKRWVRLGFIHHLFNCWKSRFLEIV